MKKVINRGYTVEVVSWENDGDNYRTRSVTYPTKQEALAVKHMCNNLFLSNTNGGGGIGNIMDYEYEEGEAIVLDYIKSNPLLWGLHKNDYTEGDDDNAMVELVSKINGDLLGGSEYYYSRICESCVVYYSPEDVLLEIIE